MIKMSSRVCLVNEYEIPELDEIPRGHFIIQTDAGFKKGIVGVGVIIKTNNKEYSPRKYTARCKGPVHAELTAIKYGLARIRDINKPMEKIVVCSDNLSAVYLLRGVWMPRKDYIVDIVRKIQLLVKEITIEVNFEYVRSKTNKKVDKIAYKKRKQEEARKAEQIEQRRKKIKQAMIKAKDLTVNEIKGKYYVRPNKGGFPPGIEVSLDPLFCKCRYWRHNWADKPVHVQMARALPCKHMCALAEYLGVDPFKIFKRQIERVDQHGEKK